MDLKRYTYDEVLALRDERIAAAELLQLELSNLPRTAGKPFRMATLKKLHEARQELRELKTWLHQKSPERQSEWKLLGQLYREIVSLLDGHEEQDPDALGRAAPRLEELLRSVEAFVPPEHLTAGDAP